MVTKNSWLDAGLRVLAEEGVGTVRIERLSADLSVSKGSFYHHFSDGMPSYQRELLAHYEQRYTSRFIDAVESETRTATEKIQLLRRLVIDDETDRPHLEAAIRAWAAHDGEARRTLERVDATRIDYLRSLWAEVSGNDDESLVMARLLYSLLLGAQHVLPQIDAKGVDDIYDVVLGAVLKEQP